MGAGWKHPQMAAKAAARGAKITKLVREIQVAAKLGGADPDSNARLRSAVTAAKAALTSKETIDRAIKKGAGLLDDGGQIDEVTYEGFGPHRVAIIVECLTDNRNRTAADIRSIFNKNGGQLGESGSVGWMFNRVSLIEASASKTVDPEEEAIEAGANEVEKISDTQFRFLGAPEDLKAIEAALIARGWKIATSEMSYKAKTQTEITDAQKNDLMEFVSLIEDNEDASRIHISVDL